jgi:general secretion pathway protein G
MQTGWKKQTGFTIVELLIVIVVIGILAAITIVAFNGVQLRANDARRDTDMKQIKAALELYKTDNDAYPAVCSGDGVGCSTSSLAAVLAPTYMASVPQDPKFPSVGYSYVRGNASSYGIWVKYEAKPACKTGVNVNTGWWGAGVPIC